jgi:hypothetical protein
LNFEENSGNSGAEKAPRMLAILAAMDKPKPE